MFVSLHAATPVCVCVICMLPLLSVLCACCHSCYSVCVIACCHFCWCVCVICILPLLLVCLCHLHAANPVHVCVILYCSFVASWHNGAEIGPIDNYCKKQSAVVLVAGCNVLLKAVFGHPLSETWLNRLIPESKALPSCSSVHSLLRVETLVANCLMVQDDSSPPRPVAAQWASHLCLHCRQDQTDT